MKPFIPLTLFLGTFFASATSAAVANGEKAPDFTLPAASGEEVSLSDFEGQYVVLEWVNPGCPFVKKFYDAGKMQAFQAEAQGKDVVWLSINSTHPDHSQYVDEEETAAYIEEKGVKSEWLFDPEAQVARLYEARRTPHMYIIDPEGTLIYQGAIDDQNSADPATLESAHNYVFAALDAARAGKPIERAQTRPYGCTVDYD